MRYWYRSTQILWSPVSHSPHKSVTLLSHHLHGYFTRLSKRTLIASHTLGRQRPHLTPMTALTNYYYWTKMWSPTEGYLTFHYISYTCHVENAMHLQEMWIAFGSILHMSCIHEIHPVYIPYSQQCSQHRRVCAISFLPSRGPCCVWAGMGPPREHQKSPPVWM